MSISTPRRSEMSSSFAGDTTQTASTQKQRPFRDDQIMDDQIGPDWGDQDGQYHGEDEAQQQVEHYEQQVVPDHRQIKDKEEEPDHIDDVVNISRVTKLLKKRMREPKNIPKLVKAWKGHIKAAKRIEKALDKMGCKVRAMADTSSSEDVVHTAAINQQFMQLSAKMGMNNN